MPKSQRAHDITFRWNTKSRFVKMCTFVRIHFLLRKNNYTLRFRRWNFPRPENIYYYFIRLLNIILHSWIFPYMITMPLVNMEAIKPSCSVSQSRKIAIQSWNAPCVRDWYILYNVVFSLRSSKHGPRWPRQRSVFHAGRSAPADTRHGRTPPPVEYVDRA